jgi:hypothetical protein
VIQSHFLAVWPGSGENSSRFNRDSGMRRYSQREAQSTSEKTTSATNGLMAIASNSTT